VGAAAAACDPERPLVSRTEDCSARDLAIREFARPVLIEAGAGTGKTRTLVARIGTWLLGPGWEQAAAELAAERASRPGADAPADAEVAARACEGVVAITFTDAAAAEMAERIERLLSQAAGGVRIADLERLPEGLEPAVASARAHLLLAASARLRVSTIHGFCHRLLAEVPLEAGLHPAYGIDADGDRTRELATAVLLDRLRGGDPRLVELLAAGVDPPALLEALLALVGAGVAPAELESDPFAGDVLARRIAALRAAIDELRRAAEPLGGARRVDSIVDGLAALDRLDARLAESAATPEGVVALAPDLEEAAQEASKILEEWAGGRFGRTEEKALGAELPRLRDAAESAARAHRALAELDPPLLLAARAALGSPLRELVEKRRAAGVLSFDELLERAVRLLAERPAVRARVRRGLRQLLVDEFQDTDARQCELVRALVLAESAAPAPGLFVVGDPQQSIYGWRSADLAAYAAFRDELISAGGLFGRLAINFRSARPVLDEVERALAPVLVERPGLQAGFQRLLVSDRMASHEGFRAAGRAPVEYWLDLDPDAIAAGRATRGERATAIEAAAVAREIAALVEERHAGFGDFAILLRARSDLETYLDALRRRGVPYVVQKDRSYYRRREVVDAAAAVRAILDPPDLLALVAFLRSPFVGVPDAAWLPLWRTGFPGAMVELEGEHGRARVLETIERAESDPALDSAPGAGGWADALRDAVGSIAALRDEFRRLPAGEWVERLRARLLLEPIAAARFLGRFGLANLERLLDEVESDLAAEADPARALARLRSAVSESKPTEEARPPEQGADAVAVMTIHTAKGLEFEHVYLVQCHREGGGPRGGALPGFAFGPHAPAREMVLFGAPTPGWREVERARDRVAAAEAARLLYVATTRAVQRLVLLGRFSEASAERREEEVPSFASLLAARVGGAPLPQPGDPVRRDEHGALWRAPALEPGWSDAVDPAERPAPPVAVEPTAAELAALDRRRTLARARAARPRIAAASFSGEPPPAGAESTDGEANDVATALLPGFEPRRRSAAVARALGVALHRALEAIGAGDDSPIEIARAAYRGARPAADAVELAGLERALERLDRSALANRLRTLAERRLASELPLLLAADPRAETGPLEGHTGTLDLLYRDEHGGLVVADFKSDPVDGPDGIAALAARYRPQLELYGRAVREALGLPSPPRLELWLLDRDEIHQIGSS
jgi:ATP-dependent exoDNAse (exonuclease V) beta subunit